MTRPVVLPPVRCTPLELGRWKDAAASQGLSLSEWVRRELALAADFALAPTPPPASTPFVHRPKKV